ncbi:MAG TPA: c-type cytochrome biogenesis protein CcmI [Burkholderiales bacterium]
MTAFWLIGAGLAAGVLAWVLWPLLSRKGSGPVSRQAVNVSIYRDQLRELETDLAAGTLAQADYERARAELEARLMEDVREPDAVAQARPAGRGMALALGAAIPVLALAVYFAVGDPATLSREAEHGATVQQIETMVARLAARLRENPDDAEGWKLLGRSYAALGRFADAADAYAKAAVRTPRDAQLLVDFADVLAMARGQRLEGEPEKLIQRALEIDPQNLKGLALAGTVAFERKDYAQAAAYWQRMLPLVPADSEDARVIQQNVAEAKSLAGTGSAASTLRGTVSISPTLKSKAAPDDIVFVFARAAEGPPMPLAVARARVRDLPYSFRLDDSMAMTPAMKLSAFPRVVVGARVSKSGNATPQPGDLQGASAPVANDAGEVRVVIDRVVP